MTDDELDREVAYRYPSGERPKYAPTEHPAFYAEEPRWENYGDAHPFEHGGRFLKWHADRGMWRMMVTHPPNATPFEEQMFEEYWFEPQDVWDDPDDPWTDFTREMKQILRSLGDEHQLPSEGPFLERVGYYVADLGHYLGGGEDSYVEDDREAFWSALEGRLDGFDREDGETDTGYHWLLD